MPTYRTIILKGDPVRDDARKAAETIIPGMLCELASTNKVQKHSTPGGSAEKLFALEDENQGKEIGGSYSADEIILTGIFRPGDEVCGLLADGENAAVGSKLESNGDGYLRVVDSDASVGDIGIQSIVGVALEPLDMSGSSGVDPSSQRLRVRII